MSAPESGSVERELKLGAPSDFAVPDLTGVAPGVQAVEAPTLDLDATYYDTPDLRLVRDGVSLRRRTGEGDPRWTLKLPATSDDESLARREIDVVEPGLEVPGRLAELVTGWVRSAPLEPVVVIRSHRRRVRLLDADGQELAEVDDDQVTVLDGDVEVGRFREVEVELAGAGTSDLLGRVGEAMAAAGAGDPDPTSKVKRGLGDRASAPSELLAPVLGPTSSVDDLVRAALLTPVGVLVAADHVLRLDDDPDGVRHARGALRRWRAHLAVLAPVLDDGWAEHLRDEVHPLLEVLSTVRRTDALDARLLRSVGALPSDLRPAAVTVIGRLDREREGQMAEVHSAIAGTPYVALLDDLVVAATDPRLGTATAGDAPAAEALPALVQPAWRHLQRAVDHLDHHPDAAALDHVRSLARTAQAAAALAAPVVGEPASLLARGLDDLREVLRTAHVAHRAEVWLDETTPTLDGPQRDAADALRALQHDDAEAARRRWRDTWGGCDTRRATGWLA